MGRGSGIDLDSEREVASIRWKGRTERLSTSLGYYTLTSSKLMVPGILPQSTLIIRRKCPWPSTQKHLIALTIASHADGTGESIPLVAD